MGIRTPVLTVKEIYHRLSRTSISKLLGHADRRITAKHYAHLADKTLALAVKKLPSFSGAAKSSNLVRVSL